MRKERNLRYQMRKKGYLFNREQRVAILPEDSKKPQRGTGKTAAGIGI
jgi:hypothetical protein|nr:MAG TPA: hypothetical protein [Caudoviricetes sp.]